MGQPFSQLIADARGAHTPPIKVRLADLAERYKPSDEVAAAIAAALRARSAGVARQRAALPCD